jgi:hypothetical protein
MLDRSLRWLTAAGGGLMMLGGFALAAAGMAVASGILLIFLGAALVVAVVLQHNRYRSLAAEHAGNGPGPGGGEDGPLEPRFTATPEVFVDPTSGRLMRVYVDLHNGERRYRAEG